MGSGTLARIQEFLPAVYRPDRDHAGAMGEERRPGEHDHARLQSRRPV